VRRVLGFLCVLVGASFAAIGGASGTGSAAPTGATPKASAAPAQASAAPAKAGAASTKTSSQPDKSTSAKPVQAKPVASKLAPADEYFGPMKMSILGIKNEIRDLTVRYEPYADGDHHLSKSIMTIALLTEASLADFEKRYPNDNQLARDVYFLQKLYAKIDSDDARAKAKYCSQWLLSRYSASSYARDLRTTLASQPPSAVQPAVATDQSHAAGTANVIGAGAAPSSMKASIATPPPYIGAGAGVPASVVPAPAPSH
jgi:hypothetical protein